MHHSCPSGHVLFLFLLTLSLFLYLPHFFSIFSHLSTRSISCCFCWCKGEEDNAKFKKKKPQKIPPQHKTSFSLGLNFYAKTSHQGWEQSVGAGRNWEFQPVVVALAKTMRHTGLTQRKHFQEEHSLTTKISAGSASLKSYHCVRLAETRCYSVPVSRILTEDTLPAQGR